MVKYYVGPYLEVKHMDGLNAANVLLDYEYESELLSEALTQNGSPIYYDRAVLFPDKRLFSGELYELPNISMTNKATNEFMRKFKDFISDLEKQFDTVQIKFGIIHVPTY